MNLQIFNRLKFVTKSYILIALVVVSMLLIIGLSLYAVFSFKQDIDILFNKRTIPVVKLENLKDFYKINIYETIQEYKKHEINYNQAKEAVSLAKEVIDKTWEGLKPYRIVENDFEKLLFENLYEYKKKIDKQIENFLNKKKINYSVLKNNINKINLYLSDIINIFIRKAVEQKRKTDKKFAIVISVSFIFIILIFLISVGLVILIVENFKETHKIMEKKIREKTKELEYINKNLEKRIKKAIEENSKKDKIMFQQNKLASMGEMLQNISHQWRQPLTNLGLILQAVIMKKEYGNLSDEYLERKLYKALDIIENMSKTIEDFRNFFRPDKIKKRLNIKECIEKSVKLLSYEFEKYNVEVEIKAEDIYINGYANELSHVCLNLLSNSLDEFKKKNGFKKILITAKENKNDIIINVIDNAGGIKADVEKIFEPYYTTKFSSGGSGIGLYMAKQIIETHMGGRISAKNIKHKMGTESFYDCAMFEIVLKKNDEKL